MNYLELCQQLSLETDAPIGTPVSFDNLSPEESRIVNWIRSANREIQQKWTTWKFLWSQHSFVTEDSVTGYLAPDDLGEWDMSTCRLDGSSIDCYEYSPHIDVDYVTTGKPWQAIVIPDNSLRLVPVPDGEYTITMDYFKAPQELMLADDIPWIPVKFHMLIVYTAMLHRGYYESAEEIVERARTKFEELMSRLEASQLYGNRYHSNHQDELVVRPE